MCNVYVIASVLQIFSSKKYHIRRNKWCIFFLRILLYGQRSGFAKCKDKVTEQSKSKYHVNKLEKHL